MIKVDQLAALVVVEEKPFVIKQLERVVLGRIVGRCDGDAAASRGSADVDLDGRGGKYADVHHFATGGEEAAPDGVEDHFTGGSSVAADNDAARAQETYSEMSRDFVAAVPSSLPIVDQINNEILTGSLYKALKAAQRLIEYEQDLLNHASNRRPGVPADGEDR